MCPSRSKRPQETLSTSHVPTDCEKSLALKIDARRLTTLDPRLSSQPRKPARWRRHPFHRSHDRPPFLHSSLPHSLPCILLVYASRLRLAPDVEVCLRGSRGYWSYPRLLLAAPQSFSPTLANGLYASRVWRRQPRHAFREGPPKAGVGHAMPSNLLPRRRTPVSTRELPLLKVARHRSARKSTRHCAGLGR